MPRSLVRGGSYQLSPRHLFKALTVGFALVFVAIAVLTRLVPLTGRTTLIVGGPSMTPALQVGTLLVEDPVAPDGLAVGDVVSIRSGPQQAIFTHRITRLIERDGAPWIETKGDANPSADPSILPASAVIGRVVLAVPLAGYLVALGSQPSGIVLIIALGLLLMTLASVGRRVQTLPA